MMPRFATLAHVLRHHADSTPARTLYRFLNGAGVPDETLTYAGLDTAAASLAGRLAGRRSERALLLYPPGLEFVKAFFACLYAGVVPVPVYLPGNRPEHWARLAAIAQDARATLLLVDDKHAPAVHDWLASAQASLRLELVVTGGDLPPQPLVQLPAEPGALAFLQYTSGSTGEPKGVMVTHENLLANQRLIRTTFEHDSDTVVVGWLPQYHDMGLIGNILQPLYLGATAVLMAPLTFLQQPIRWLEAIARYRATTSGGPDFAYRLCVERITEEQKQGLDLSCWTLAFNGAEPVGAATLDRFADAFGAVGFRRQAFFPCYGLAEATLLVTGAGKHAEPTTLWLDRAAAARDVVVVAGAASAAGQPFVSSGDVGAAAELAIVDPHTRQACADDRIGEIWLRGASVTAGYWQRPALTEQVFHATQSDGEGPYLRTGDLGFVRDGKLYVTGRLKDLIIIRGRNHYPHDIEHTVQQAVPGLRHGAGACFSVREDNEERLVLMQEVERAALRRGDFGHIWEQAAQVVAAQHGVSLYALLLVKPGTLPKTSSGKLRRGACRDAYERNEVDCVASFRSAPASGNAAPAPTDWSGTGTRGAQALDLLADVLGLAGPAQLLPQRSLGGSGLDSMSAAELQHRLASELRIRVDLGELMSGMTVQQFVDRADRADALDTPAHPAPAGHAEVRAPSHNERTLWQVQTLYRNAGAAYNLGAAFRIARLDPARLAAAWSSLLERQPILRTGYREVDGKLTAVTGTGAPCMTRDAAGWDDDTLRRNLGARAAEAIDLAAGSPARLELFLGAAAGDVLLLVVHHVAADAWSMQVLVAQLLDLYDSAAPVTRHADVVPYARFAEIQRTWLDSDAGRAAAQRYRQLVAGISPILDLPADRVRPPQFGFRGGVVDFTLRDDLLAALQRRAAELDITLFTLLLAAYQLFLAHYSGAKQFLVGVPVSERPVPEFRDTVGCFVDLKPIPCHVHPDATFREFALHTRTHALAVLECKYVPGQRVVEEQLLGNSWPSTVAPNIRFALQQARVLPGAERLLFGMPGSRYACAGIDLESVDLPLASSTADLALTLLVDGPALRGRFGFNGELFDAARIRGMRDMFQQLVERIVDDVDRPIREISLAGAAEQARQVAKATRARADFGRPRCIHALIEDKARTQPAHVAVVFEDASCTYDELNRRANRVAHALHAHGVQPEDRIGLCLHRSIDLVVAFLGALKAGACSVMLEPSLPPERARYIVGNSRLRVMLTNDDTPPGAWPDGVASLDVRPLQAHGPDTDPVLGLTPEHAAYIIYTSGSTGNPKGVIGLHAAIYNRTQWMIRHFAIGADDAVLHSTPLGFVRAEREMLFPLAAGARLVMLPSAGINRPDAILAAMERHRVSFTASSPSLLKMILAEGRERFAHLSHLRWWFVGADILKPALVNDILRARPGLRLTYFYGSTEVCSDVAHYDIDGTMDPDVVTTPIGTAIPNNDLYLLDPNLQPVGAGMVGEIYVGGVQLARGYVDNEALTDARFIPDPFNPRAGARLYRTGDLAYERHDGHLVVTGREDDQVNLYGHRVELGEVEHALRGIPGVRDVIVLVKEDGAHPLLVAYIVSDVPPQAATLKRQLAERLPAYMIPAFFVPVDAIPITPLGKLDRQALRQIGLGGALETAHAAPSSPMHETMVGILSDLTGLPAAQIGIDRNFFDLGLNSVMLNEFAVKLRARHPGMEVGIADVYQHHTVAALATTLSEAVGTADNRRRAGQSRAQARRVALHESRRRS